MWLNSRLMYLWNRWPLIIWSLQRLILYGILLAIFLLIVYSIILILTPGFLEGLGLVTLITAPATTNYVVTNNLIAQNAVRLNMYEVSIDTCCNIEKLF
jgi:predicted membrane metal-binding protein